MTQIKGSPAGQNALADPAHHEGQPGPVTLVLGTDFAGVRALASGTRAGHHHGGGTAGQVQSRNAGANLCSGMPKGNPNPGTPSGG
jgi:hypothetical protein